MYEHYERHRTDNITDPAVRRSQPISTISGWDRERDESTADETAATTNATGAIAASTGAGVDMVAITNGPDGVVTGHKARKVSKSEQTDDNTAIELDTIKCACDDNDDDEDDDDVDEQVNDDNQAPTSDATTVVEPTKNVSSISNISQVYNEQISGNVIICNGNGHVSVSEDESSSQSPQKEAPMATAAAVVTGTDALRQVLEIDAYEKEDEGKEIVQELVDEILQKSETLLTDCQNVLEHETSLLNDTETSSPVIKDDEIELAVSEVVKGVLDSKKENASSNKQQLADTSSDAATVDATLTDDNQKADLELSSAIISNNNLNNNNNNNNSATDEFDYDVNDADDEEAVTISDDIIVVKDDDTGDDTHVHQSTAENCDKANRNTSTAGAVTDLVDVQLQLASVTIAADGDNQISTEDFVKCIVDEIVDKCVLQHNDADEQAASERHANNINNNNVVEPAVDATEATCTPIVATAAIIGQADATINDDNNDDDDDAASDHANNASELVTFISDLAADDADTAAAPTVATVAAIATTTCVPNEFDETNMNVQRKTIDAKDDDDQSQMEEPPTSDTPESDASAAAAKVTRSQSISTSTSTQVENNHFGECISDLIAANYTSVFFFVSSICHSCSLFALLLLSFSKFSEFLAAVQVSLLCNICIKIRIMYDNAHTLRLCCALNVISRGSFAVLLFPDANNFHSIRRW